MLQGALNDEVNRYLVSVKKTLRARHHDDLETLSAATADLRRNRAVQKAFVENDRRRLFDALKPFQRDLGRYHRITRVSIHDSAGVNFMRVHQPAHHGDTVIHSTFRKARETEQPFFGMELSESGSFTLSIVVPWHIDKRLAGYVEIEKELHYITEDIPTAMGVELISLIDKRYINRTEWEKAYRVTEGGPHWDDFADFVVVGNSFQNSPKAVARMLTTRHEQHRGEIPQIEFGGRRYCVAFFPLIDVRNRDVGDIAVFYDATAAYKRTENLLMFIGIMCVLIGIALFVSFYHMLDGLERELRESHQKILCESELRLEIEKKHAKELAAHVVELELIRARERKAAQQIADAKK